MNYYTLEDYQHEVYTFNELSGQAKKLSKEAINQQIKLVEEECKELREAFGTNDPTEVLDALGDILYVALGLQQKLEMLGFNCLMAYDAISENNLSKFPHLESEALTTQKMYKDKGVEVEVAYNDIYDVFSVKDANGKVRKPSEYKSVNLEQFVPVNFKKGFPDEC